MDQPDNHSGFWITVAGIIISIVSFRWLMNIFSKEDGKKGLSFREFQRLAAFILFYGGIIYMLYNETNRTTEYHLYNDFWMAMWITGLFSCLHMDDILEKATRLIIALRTKTAIPSEEPKP